MQPDKRDSCAMLPLTPAVFHILLALADGERHGYSIMQEIAVQTRGALRVGPTTLYRSIKNMLQAGLIEESEERPDPEEDDERRRYYRMTELGWRVATEEIQRLERAIAVAHSKSSLRSWMPAPSNESV